jgi:cation:H+ antiporter
MILINLALFLVSLAILLGCANYAIKYSSKIAKIFSLPEFIISFFIIAFISILPESTISIISAFNSQPELGLGTLLGSNVTDLTLVLGIAALFSLNKIKVKSKIIKNNIFYVLLLLFPIILGLDGEFSRVDGLILVLLGCIFLVKIYIDNSKTYKRTKGSKREPFLKVLFLLILSLGVLLTSAFFTVKFAVNFANDIKLPVILIGLTILAIGTCLPELVFSIKAIRKNHGELALGDIMGTVIIDATIILGIVAIISPFSYNLYNIYITGTIMFLAGVLVTIFMKTDKALSRLEGLLLILFYIAFIIVEFFVNSSGGIK